MNPDPIDAVAPQAPVAAEGEALARAMRLVDRMLAPSADAREALAAFCELVENEGLAQEDALALGQRLLASTWPQGKAKALARLVGAADAQASGPLLEALAPGSGSFALELRLALAWSRAGRFQQAQELLATVRRQQRGRAAAMALLEAEILLWEGAPEQAAERVRNAVAEGLASSHEYRRAITVLLRTDCHVEAAQLMEAALRTWPSDWTLLLQMRTCRMAPQQFLHHYLGAIDGMEAAASDNLQVRYRLAQCSLTAGDFERAARLLGAPGEAMVAQAVPLARLVASRPPERWSALLRLEDDSRRDVQVASSPGARATVVLLCRQEVFSALPPAMVDAWLAERGCNTIVLRDFRRAAFLLGVRGLAADEAGTIAALRAQLARLGAPRTIVMGSSVLGFPAMRYAALLGADLGISLAGFTRLEQAQRADTALMLARHARLDQLRKLLPPDRFDLRPVVAAAPGTRILHFHGAENAEDRVQAERLHGLPNVRTVALPEVAEHSLGATLLAGNWLDEVLPLAGA